MHPQNSDHRSAEPVQPHDKRRQDAAWKQFWNQVALDMFGAARDCIAGNGPEGDEADEDVEIAMIERVSSEVGLDTARWLAWVAEVNDKLPDDAGQTRLWPQHLPSPPPEPERAATALVKRTGHDRLETVAASWILYHLSLARAVRNFQRK